MPSLRYPIEDLTLGAPEVWCTKEGSSARQDSTSLYIPWSCNLGFGELRIALDKDGNLYADTEHMCSNDNKEFLRLVLLALLEKIEIEV